MKPLYSIVYNSKDFVAEFDKAIQSVTYSFALSGKADDMSIVVENSAHRFLSDAYPKTGDTVWLGMGYAHPGQILDCGEFEVDAPSFDLYEKMVTLQGASTSIKKSLYEKRYEKYESTTLKKILAAVAKRNELTLKGKIASLNIRRKTQSEPDLEFLNSLAERYGYIFKIDAGDLIFSPYGEIENGEVAFEVTANDLLSGSTIEDSKRTYQFCECTYFVKGKKYKKKVEDSSISNGIILKIEERVENVEQAEQIAAAALYRANRDSISGSLVFPGEPTVADGVIISLKDGGELTGLYCVKSGNHAIDGGDGPFLTTVEVYRV